MTYPLPASWTYTIPPGVHAATAGGRPALTTPQGGQVVVDRRMLALWRQAGGRSPIEIAASDPGDIRLAVEQACALACLAQAGLLHRSSEAPSTVSGGPACPPSLETDPTIQGSPLVSAIIVSYNSREWLPGCFASLQAQSYPALETIVVDNGSQDGSADWIASQPETRLLRLPAVGSLAGAINAGIAAAQGAYYLVLNPDLALDGQAVERMLAVAVEDPHCAAVAAKLRFLWAPAFLNGLGNFVGAFSYGADSALGHLDLGQFDGWNELPSACFAAALLPAAAVRAVGLPDEGFPMYYEDSEWCYRARLLGWRVRLAPQAVVYHAFSGRVPSGEESGLAAAKLRRVTYGRLRFITRLLDDRSFLRFKRRYRLEDALGASIAMLRGRKEIRGGETRRAYQLGWQDYQEALPGLLDERRRLQTARQCRDAELFALQRRVPPPLIWHGLPLLTWAAVERHYLPWLLGEGRGRFPETAALPPEASYRPRPAWQRWPEIWQDEGLGGMLHHLARSIQWKLQMDL